MRCRPQTTPFALLNLSAEMLTVALVQRVLKTLVLIVALSGEFQFLREELHYENGHERRQKAFHRDDDMHISVSELWHIWTRSEVHNWTVEQTLEWLKNFVQLPQYVAQFQQHGVNGASLPR